MPPVLYDLAELQRHANRLFAFSAQKTLDIAQSLCDRYKSIGYRSRVREATSGSAPIA
jgi:DNA topoisomerase-3